MAPAERLSSMRWFRRVRRVFLWMLGILAGLLGLALVLFLLAPVRSALLEWGLEMARTALPGTLTVRRATWPEPGTFRFEGPLWTAEGDTLASAAELEISVRLPRLLAGEIQVPELLARDVQVDVPAMTARLGGSPPDRTKEHGGRGGFGPLDRGALPFLPSLSLDHVEIDAPRIRLAEGATLLGVRLRASLSNLPEDGPWLRLEELAGRMQETGWSAETDSLVLDLPHRSWSGSLRAALGDDWPVSLRLGSPGTSGEFSLDLDAGTPAGGPAPLALEVQGRADVTGTRLREVGGTARFRIPGPRILATVPPLAGKLDALPAWEGVAGSIEGRYTFDPSPSFRAALDLAPSTWLAGGEIAAHGDPSQVRLDSLRVALPEAVLTGSGEIRKRTLSARARVEMVGLAWMPALGLGEPFADSLQANVEIRAEGPLEHPGISARLHAGAKLGGLTLDRVDLEAALPEGGTQPVVWNLEAGAEELVLSGRGDLSLGEPMQLALSPLRVRGIEAAPSPPSSARGTVTLDSGAVQAKNVRIEGALGNWTVNASMDRSRHGRGEIRASWPDPPPPLLARLSLADSSAVAFTELWREDGPFELRLTSSFDLSQGTSLRGDAEVRLPGPSTLRPSLPAGMDLAGLGPLALALDFDLGSGAHGSRFHGTLDPSGTEWISGGPIRVEAKDGTLRVDTLDVAIEGLEISGRGMGGPESLSADLRVFVANDTLLRRLVPSATEADSLRMLLTASAEGTPQDPVLHARIEAGAILGTLRVPRLLVDAGLEEGTATLQARTEDGLTAGSFRLDSLEVAYRTLEPDSIPFPGFVSVDAVGPDLEVRNRTEIHRVQGWRFLVEALRIGTKGGDLAGEHPFTVEIRDSGMWSIQDMLLTGALGRVELEGDASPDSIHARARVELALEEIPRPPQFPRDFWPQHLDADFSAETPEKWDFSTTATGMKLPDGNGLTLGVDAVGSPGGIQAQIKAHTTEHVLMDGSVEVPVVLTLAPFGVNMHDGEIRADLHHRNLPLPVDALQLEAPGLRGAMLNGYVRVRGTMARPEGRIDLSLLVPQPGAADSLRLALVGMLATGELQEGRDALADSITTLGGDVSPLGGTGLRAALVLDRGSDRLLRGGLTLPMTWTDQKIQFAPPGRDADLELHSPSLPLETLTAFLPAHAGIEGTLALDFRARGGIQDPSLEGKLRSDRFSLTLRNGLRITNSASLALAGSARAPEVTGKVVVVSGTLPIPESEAERHPVHGEALLWNLQAYAPASADSNGASAPTPPDAPRVLPKLDVKIDVPTGLWIRGRDLNVELTGDLQLKTEGQNPVVVGNLKARSGTLILLGRTFDVSRGTVTFYGEETINPRLDITLESRISSTLVKVLVTGTAEKPELKLASEPEMSETDILSLIVFGRSSTELNGDEVQLMAQQAATMAALYGTSGLTQSLSRELGVDMLTINPSGGSEGQSTVVVGKYLSPRTLIKYEQTLQGVSEFFVTLEYRLTNYFTVQTIVGPTQSGAGVSWTRDY